MQLSKGKTFLHFTLLQRFIKFCVKVVDRDSAHATCTYMILNKHIFHKRRFSVKTEVKLMKVETKLNHLLLPKTCPCMCSQNFIMNIQN